MLTLYGMSDSGNCYKPRLLLALLNRAFRHVEINALDGSTRQPDFLARNPNGQVPLLELEDGRLLWESNAILLYLAEGTAFLPDDPYLRAVVCQWLFFEQYSHEPYIAVRRALIRYPERAAEATPARLSSTLDKGHHALAVMERRLAANRFMAGESCTVADIALYPYTRDARYAGFEMDRFPAISTWLDRIEAQPGHVPMTWLPR